MYTESSTGVREFVSIAVLKKILWDIAEMCMVRSGPDNTAPFMSNSPRRTLSSWSSIAATKTIAAKAQRHEEKQKI